MSRSGGKDRSTAIVGAKAGAKAGAAARLLGLDGAAGAREDVPMGAGPQTLVVAAVARTQTLAPTSAAAAVVSTPKRPWRHEARGSTLLEALQQLRNQNPHALCVGASGDEIMVTLVSTSETFLLPTTAPAATVTANLRPALIECRTDPITEAFIVSFF